MIPTRFQVHSERPGFSQGSSRLKVQETLIRTSSPTCLMGFTPEFRGFLGVELGGAPPAEFSDSGLTGATFKGFERRVNIF